MTKKPLKVLLFLNDTGSGKWWWEFEGVGNSLTVSITRDYTTKRSARVAANRYAKLFGLEIMEEIVEE